MISHPTLYREIPRLDIEKSISLIPVTSRWEAIVSQGAEPDRCGYAARTEVMSTSSSPVRQLSMLSLVGVTFFIVCGGPYGLEEAVKQLGAWWTIALVAAIPFLWSVPISLMVAELATLMPEEGGYYAWVRRELGDFWGSQVGWWALWASVVDMALYPVLFVRYLSHLVPSLQLDAPLARWLVAAAIVGLALALNLRGVRTVGRNAVLTLAIVLTPLLVFSALVIWQHGPLSAVVEIVQSPPDNLTIASFATGLSVVMWNYMGWDSASTLAGQVEKPQRNYPRALAIVTLLTLSAYLVPLLAGLTIFPEQARWSDWTVWSNLGKQVAGAWLGIAIAVAGLLAQWSLFNSNLLYSSRLPYAMARDGWLSATLAHTGRGGSPAASLCVLAAIAAGLTAWPFGKLVVVDVLLNSAVLALEFAVLIRLRLKAPQKARAFRIAGGWPVLSAITLAPLLCVGCLLWATIIGAGDAGTYEGSAAAVFDDDAPAQNFQLGIVTSVVGTGIAVYFLKRKSLSRAS